MAPLSEEAFHERGFSQGTGSLQLLKRNLISSPVSTYHFRNGRKLSGIPAAGRIEALPAAQEDSSPSPEKPVAGEALYNPPLPPESAQKEMLALPAPDASSAPKQTPSGKGNGKLRPFVPVRIVIAPQTEENAKTTEVQQPPAAGPDGQVPGYVPPAPPEGKAD